MLFVSREGRWRSLNKKIPVVTVTILAVAMMAVSSVAFVQASKVVVPFSYTGGLTSIRSGEVDVQWTPDYSTRIARGTWRLYSYSGPLGIGTYYSEALISITHYDNETLGYTTWNGGGVYRILYNITSGPYGVGTLEGISTQKWDYDFQRTPKNVLFGNATLQHGTGGLRGVRMVYDFNAGVYTGEVILP